MKAIMYRRFGSPDVLEFVEIPKPTPKDHEVLIKVRATTVTAADWRCRSKILPKGWGFVAPLVLGFSRPRRPILGTELSGDVESVGKGITKFKVGDAVFGFPGLAMGCYVAYRCMAEDGPLARKPPSLSYEEAAALSFGSTTALGFFKRAGLKKGDKVLVNGASGGVGTAAVQLAKHLGAEVTGVCSSANLALVKSLGADRVIDYTQEDCTRNGETYDLVVDNVGTAPFSRSKDSLKRGGRLLMVVGTLPDMFQAPWVSMMGDKKVITGSPKWGPEDLAWVAGLAESGAFKSVIDRRYPFEQMREAHLYVDAGHKKGNVVVTV